MFLTDDFILKNSFAKELYHGYAKKQPIIDYHCHLDPKEIFEDQNFTNLTQAWLAGDHYKWRLMRANGVAESLITGDADDYEKFCAWAQTLEACIGNPLYVWIHLELKRIFGIDERLTLANAASIWEKANQQLQTKEFSPRGLIKKMAVEVICTTDDPIDSLTYHQKLAEESFAVYPTFRPDKAINLQNSEFPAYLKQLAAAANKEITSYQTLVEALAVRIFYFQQRGCRLADHSLSRLGEEAYDTAALEAIFQKRLTTGTLTNEEIRQFQTGLLIDLMRQYAKQGWTAQLHLMATRNNSQKLFQQLGPDSGGDAMGDDRLASGLSRTLAQLQAESLLPKTILYSLNPKDYPVLTALMGAFQEESKGKLQLGSAWWFNDTYSGMRHQLTTLAEGGILGNFVGMLTDSRSFLSYPRHEYFRRILCQVISEWVEDGQLLADEIYLGQIVADISYHNAKTYFDFPN